MTTTNDDPLAGVPALEEVCSMPLVDEVCVLSRNPAYGHSTGFRMESRLVNQEWCFHNSRRPWTTALFTDWLPSVDLAARELRRLVGWWHVCNEAWQAAKKAET